MMFLESELSKEESTQDGLFWVIPVPLERTVSYGLGTQNGPSAILVASNELERNILGQEPCSLGIYTNDPIDCSGKMPEIMARIAGRTKEAASLGKVPVTLGGEHSLTYGAVMGVKAALGEEDLGIIQIDAHADLRVDYQGERHSHASVMNLLVREKGIKLAQFGVRALSLDEHALRIQHKVHYQDAERLVLGNILDANIPENFPKNVYVSFDVDGLDPSTMPATGTPVPGGIGFYQAFKLIGSALRGRRLVGFDVVELAPRPGELAWDFTAAQIVYRLMAIAQNRR